MSALSRWWPLPQATDLRDRLVAAYAEPMRRCHDLRHLQEVLENLDHLLPAGHDAKIVRLAAWFHDAVYVGSADDEEQSARFAERALAGLLDADDVAEVARLVRLTATHQPDPDDVDGCLLSDADLAILGSAPARYREYVAAVREEYAHVPDTDFAVGRAAILRDLLAKPLLFETQAARDRWEVMARQNITDELAGL